jgi:hypothetical protein
MLLQYLLLLDIVISVLLTPGDPRILRESHHICQRLFQ